MGVFVKVGSGDLVEQVITGTRKPAGFLEIVLPPHSKMVPVIVPLDPESDAAPVESSPEFPHGPTGLGGGGGETPTHSPPPKPAHETKWQEVSLVGEGQVAVSGAVSLRDLAVMMLVDGVLVPRPISPVPEVNGNKITVPPCPEGTRILVYDMAGQELMGEIVSETDDLAEVIGLSDPGQYEVEVHAPHPHVFSRTKVTIL